MTGVAEKERHEELAESLADRGVSEERAPDAAAAILEGDTDRVVALFEEDLAELDALIDQYSAQLDAAEGHSPPSQVADVRAVLDHAKSAREAFVDSLERLREADPDELIEATTQEHTND